MFIQVMMAERLAMRDLNEIIIFAKIVELGSFSKAAQFLGIPKSNVSQKLAHLEECLGVRLLQRSTRQMSLTPTGELFYKHCERIITELDAANAVVLNQQESPRGLLRLSLPVALGQHFILPIIDEFLDQFPDIRLKLLLTDHLVDVIDEGFDLVIRMGQLADSSLVARRLGVVRQRIFASTDYLAKRGTPKTIEELVEHDCLGQSGNADIAQWKLVGAGAEKTVCFTPRVVCNDPLVLLSMVSAGLGIAMIPDILLSLRQQDEKLVCLFPEWSAPPKDCHALFPSHRGMAPTVRVFLDFVIRRFSVVSSSGGT
ncbi:MAG: LysR family transcriptional regulator [Rhodospirillales bacterium]|nr:LysR family transcriptional regulator [Rhodospirillales bacterium]